MVDEKVVLSRSVAKPETGQDVRIDIYNSQGQVFQSNVNAEPDIQGRYSADVYLQAYFVNDVVGEYKAVKEKRLLSQPFSLISRPFSDLDFMGFGWNAVPVRIEEGKTIQTL